MSATHGTTDFDPKYDHYTYPVVSLNDASGHPGHTDAIQNAKVYQLRSELQAEGFTERLDTITLLRFLRARKFDVALAKKMFVECEQWRKEFGVDQLMKDFIYVEKPKVSEYYPQYYHKTDKDGRPIYIEQLGKIDLTKMYEITTEQRMLQNLVVEYEKLADPRLPACSRKTGKLIETCCTIMDLKGVGIMSIRSVFAFVQSVSSISQNYYPERLGKLYVINAPWGFSTAFNVIKGFLDPVTVNKIHILGSGYQAELLGQVPAENLPVAFGGKCACEKGCEWSDAGPWQDQQYLTPQATVPAPQAAPAVEPTPTPTTTAEPAVPSDEIATNTAPVVLNKPADDAPAAPQPAGV